MFPPNIFRTMLTGLSLIFLVACNVSPTDLQTSTPSDEVTEAPSPSPTEVASVTSSAEQMVTIFLVAVGDNGVTGKKIGCDDSLISVEIMTDSTLPAPWNALDALLTLDQTYYGESGLYNALHQSTLEIQSYENNAGNATVYLQGELMLGGVCDNPRVEEQIFGTIMQDDDIEEVQVYVNGELLQEILSLK